MSTRPQTQKIVDERVYDYEKYPDFEVWDEEDTHQFIDGNLLDTNG